MRNTFDGRGGRSIVRSGGGVSGFIHSVWRIVACISAAVAVGLVPVVLYEWLGAISDYGSPRLEAVLGPLFEPLMFSAVPVLLIAVPVSSVLGAWIASPRAGSDFHWDRTTTQALVAVAALILVSVVAMPAVITLEPGISLPWSEIFFLNTAYALAWPVALVLFLLGVAVVARRLWAVRLWLAPLWLLGIALFLWEAHVRVDLAWLSTLSLLLISSVVAAPVVLAVRSSRVAAIEQAHRADAAS